MGGSRYSSHTYIHTYVHISTIRVALHQVGHRGVKVLLSDIHTYICTYIHNTCELTSGRSWGGKGTPPLLERLTTIVGLHTKKGHVLCGHVALQNR
jgi:hypothetical protein